MTAISDGDVFDLVAETYERFRPSYPCELYERIFRYIHIDESSRVLEIGIGSGKATPPILKTGCSLTAVDPGERFSALCAEKFRSFKNFSMIIGKFEDIPMEAESYDLIFSATAFHWIDEKLGYNKVFSLLKSGGVFARFANHAVAAKDDKALEDKIQELYAYYMRAPRCVEFRECDAAGIAAKARRYGFCGVEYAMFRSKRRLASNEYVALLGTYSNHLALPAAVRTEFFSKIHDAIEQSGGFITAYNTIDLELARRP